MDARIEQIRGQFQNSGRFFPEPTFTVEQLNSWEKELHFAFPPCYRETVATGSFDSENFYFLEPHRALSHPELIVFSQWNNNLFAFSTENDHKNEIYMIQHDATARIFPGFPEWLEHIYNITILPVDPE